MTPHEEVFENTRVLIRREIEKAEHHRKQCGYPSDGVNDAVLRSEIRGMRKILELVDPNPRE